MTCLGVLDRGEGDDDNETGLKEGKVLKIETTVLPLRDARSLSLLYYTYHIPFGIVLGAFAWCICCLRMGRVSSWMCIFKMLWKSERILDQEPSATSVGSCFKLSRVILFKNQNSDAGAM